MGNAVDWLKEQTVIGDRVEWVNEHTVWGDMNTWLDDQGMEWLWYVLPAVASQFIPGVREATWAWAAKAGAAGKAGLAKLGFGAPAAEGAAGAGATSPLGAGGLFGATEVGVIPTAAGGSELGLTAASLVKTGLEANTAANIVDAVTPSGMEDFLPNIEKAIDKGIEEESKNLSWWSTGLGQMTQQALVSSAVSLPFSLMQAYGQAAIADQFAPGTSTQTRTTRTTFEKPLPEISLPRYPTRTGTAAPSLEAGATEGTVLPSAGLRDQAPKEIQFQADISEKIRPKSQAELTVNVFKSLMASAKTPDERAAITEKVKILFAGLSNGQLPYGNRRGLG